MPNRDSRNVRVLPAHPLKGNQRGLGEWAASVPQEADHLAVVSIWRARRFRGRFSHSRHWLNWKFSWSNECPWVHSFRLG